MLFKSYAKTVLRITEFSKRPEIEPLNRFESFLRNPAIGVLSASFGEYTNNEEKSADNKRREIIGIALCIFSWLTVIKFYLAALINHSYIWPMIGDPFYLTKDRVLFNLVIGSIALNASLMRTLILIGQKNRKLVFVEDFYGLQLGKTHHLFRDNHKKLYIRCTLSEQFMLKQTPTNALVIFSLVYGYYTICAYQRQDYNYNLVASLIWWVLTTLAAWVTASMQGVCYSLLYLSQYYLKIRFRQINNRIINPLSNNSEILKQCLREHNQIAKRTNQYNHFFNGIIAANYMAATLAINLLFFIAFLGRGDNFFRIANGFIAINKILIICLATYSSAEFSNEVHRLYAPLNSLIISKRMSSRTKLMVLQVIERLAGPPIGFYCYDIFAFDKAEFFKCMCGCVGFFFLLVGVINITSFADY